MADKATGSSSASIFLDEIKSAISGGINYEPKDSNDKWVFAEVAVDSSGALISTSQDYMGSGVAVHGNDKVMWVAVKNLSTTATEGICLSFDGGTAAYDLVDGVFIGAGELVILKCPNTTTANLTAASVTMDGTYGYPTGALSGNVNVHVAAILDDV